MPYLQQLELQQIAQASIELGLNPRNLRKPLPAGYRSTFDQLDNDLEQLLSDLHKLNGDEELRDDVVPLRVWLREAVFRSESHPGERSLFLRMLWKVEAKRLAAEGPPGAAASRALSAWSEDDLHALLSVRLAGTTDEDWTDALVAAALGHRLDRGVVQLAEARGLLARVSVPRAELERIVHAHKRFEDPADWRAQLARAEGFLCRIERTQDGAHVAAGTGFLVGPDLVLTNHHVVQEFVGRRSVRGELQFRFDYKRSAKGSNLLTGVVFEPADAWLVASGPPTPSELDPSVPFGEPAEAELDFALIRLATSVGELPVGASDGGAADADSLASRRIRGWAAVTSAPASQAKHGDTVFVLQHPAGEALQLAFGRVTSIRTRRLSHDANTLPGSSGSPCLGDDLRPVALHHSGGTGPAFSDGNAGVPVHLIVARCEALGVTFPAPPT